MTSHFAAACFVRLLAMLFAATLLASPAFAQTSASFFITDDEPETPPQPAEEEDFALEDFNQDNSLASYDSYAQAAPNMVGDFFGGGFSGGVIFPNYADFPNVHFPIPLAGGGGLMKSSENNQATTQDRIIFQYSHYNNALEYPGLAPSQSLDQYVVGFEKRLFDGRWSIDIRMPFTSGAQFNDTLNGFAMDAGNVGNLNVGIKRMIYQDSRRSMVVGLAVNTPTGSDVTGNISGSNFTVHNDTVRLAPYFGARLMPNERTFIHGFVQADLTTRGNDVEENGYSFGRLNAPSLLYVDVSAGRWLYRDCGSSCCCCCEHHQKSGPACLVRGLAAIAELHLTTRLNEGDYGFFGPGGGDFRSDSRSGTVVNVTGALQANLNATTTLRVGAVAPITGSNSEYGRVDRFFDSEIIVQLNKSF